MSEYGLQSRSFFRTTTLPWASVAEIRSGISTTGIPPAARLSSLLKGPG
ncbi:PH domain-containing protein [Phytohabitans flavus]|nr:PH domain-containing protein [Phytohabitans flavus]